MNESSPANDTSVRRMHRDLLIAVTVALAAAALFSLQIFTISQDEASQFSKYPNAAVQWLSGTVAPERLVDYSPLYLWLHVAARHLLADPLPWIHVLHIILLSAAASLLYLILRRHVGMVLSLCGAATLVISRSVVIYGYIFEPEPLMIFLLTSTVFFADRRSLPDAAATGISLSLCLLTRPTFAPLIVIIPVYYWLHSVDRGRTLRSIGLFLVPVLIVSAFLSIRNYTLQQNLSPFGMNPALRFFDGNNPLAEGNRAAYPPLVNDVAGRAVGQSDYEYAVYRLFARKSSGSDLSVGGTERYWASNTNQYISDHPAHFISLTVRRIIYFFHNYRWHDLDPSWMTDQVLGERTALFIPFSVLSALALIGMIYGLGAWRQHLLCYGIVLIQAGLMALIYATDRQRVCLYPFFIFFSAIALAKLKEGAPRRWLVVGMALVLAVLFSSDLDRMKDDHHIGEGSRQFDDLMAKATLARTEGNYVGAIRASAQAYALNPRSIEHIRLADLPGDSRSLAEAAIAELPTLLGGSPSAELDHALLLKAAGKLDEAERILTSLANGRHSFLRDGDGLPEPLYHLGRIAFLRGQRDRSAEFLRRALGKHPGDPVLLSGLACLTGDTAYADRVFRYFDDVDATFYLGRACLETGGSEQALGYLSRLAEFLPDNPRVRVYRAAALSASGRYAEAAALYRSTAGERPGYVMLDDQILTAFRQMAKDGSAEHLYWYGVVLRQFGHFPEALQMLQNASLAGHPAAQAALRSMKDVLDRMSGQ